MTLFIIVGIGVLVLLAAAYFFIATSNNDPYIKFFKSMGINTKPNNIAYQRFTKLEDDKKTAVENLIRMAYSRNIYIDLDEAMTAATKSINYKKLLDSLQIILNVDPDFTFSQMVSVAKSGYDMEKFARSWADQVNAGLDINFRTALSQIQKGGSFERLVSVSLMAKRSGLEIKEERFIEEGFNNEAIRIIVYALIRSKNACIYMSDEDSAKIDKSNITEYWDTFKITPRLLKDLYLAGKDVTRFTNAMIRAHDAGVRLNFAMVDIFSISDDDFETMVANLIKISGKGLAIDQEDLIRQNISGNNITKLVTALIKANENGLNLDFSEIMKYYVQTGADVVGFVEALQISQKENLGYDKTALIEKSKNSCNIKELVQAVLIAKTHTELNIDRLSIEQHYAKTGKVLNIINIVNTARSQNLGLDFKLACQIELSEKYTLQTALDWALNPQVVEVSPSLTIVTKSGVQVTPKINITVRGKMPLIFKGYGFDILFKRINEAAASEIALAEDHEDVLKTMSEISHNILKKINAEELKKEIKTGTNRATEDQLNEYCAYQLLDVNLYDIEIGKNVKAELELRQAEIESQIQKIKAESDLVKAEADLRIAMVEQYKTGQKPNFNELHKDNLLKEKPKEIGTNYHKTNTK